jgi:hypothetical protein
MHVYEVSDFCVYFAMVDVNITIPKYPISIDNNSMKQKIKRYNITLRDHVQLLGYRGQIELIGKDLGLHGIVFNAPP